MYECEYCGEKFENSKVKANHIRWNHKYGEKGYSEDGLKEIKEAGEKTTKKLYGDKVVEYVSCDNCGKEMKIEYRKGGRGKKEKYFCSRSCSNTRSHSDETKEKISESIKEVWEDSPDTFSNSVNSQNRRFSSKSERKLGRKLESHGFKRHKTVYGEINFDVDIYRDDGIWIESDGAWHFKKVFENHDYEKTQKRDEYESQVAKERNKLLIRLDNRNYTVEEQKNFVLEKVKNWSGEGKVVKLY